VNRGWAAPVLFSIQAEGWLMSFGDFFWLLIWSFFFVCYLMILFQIITDLFRDRDLSGWWKALWVIFLIIFPFLAAIIYLIARGKGMAERHEGAARSAQAATDQYIQSVAGKGNPADQIASAKSLLDSGTITQEEFEKLKQKALAS
jgi:Short C-terminal domain/Phospholipase_D-nuclease N-terminal